MGPWFQVRGLVYKKKNIPNKYSFSINKLFTKIKTQNHCFIIHYDANKKQFFFLTSAFASSVKIHVNFSGRTYYFFVFDTYFSKHTTRLFNLHYI